MGWCACDYSELANYISTIFKYITLALCLHFNISVLLLNNSCFYDIYQLYNQSSEIGTTSTERTKDLLPSILCSEVWLYISLFTQSENDPPLKNTYHSQDKLETHNCFVATLSVPSKYELPSHRSIYGSIHIYWHMGRPENVLTAFHVSFVFTLWSYLYNHSFTSFDKIQSRAGQLK